MPTNESNNESSDSYQNPVPFIDNSGEYPKAVRDMAVVGRCFGSSVPGKGRCEAMGLTFEDTDEWQKHRSKFHPVACGESDCSILAAYRRDGAPHSYCFKHIPPDPDVVYAWHRSNTKSLVEPPKADDDHPIEAALRGV